MEDDAPSTPPVSIRFEGEMPLFAIAKRGCVKEGQEDNEASASKEGEEEEGDTEFVWLSDTQRTSPLEFWRESNDKERKVLVETIAALKPAFLMMGGDLVFSGGSEVDWIEFDAIMAPIRKERIPVFSAFGNHEYWLDWWHYRGVELMETFFYERFPHLRSRGHWYTVDYGPLRIVVLDSNQGHGPIASEEGWNTQREWYEATLREADRAGDVRGVVVAVHHPPFTNSTITSDEIHVQEAFVPAFVDAKKTLMMLSGHVHSYERFHKHGKLFVVSGGGGGPRAPLRKRHPSSSQQQQQQHQQHKPRHFLLYNYISNFSASNLTNSLVNDNDDDHPIHIVNSRSDDTLSSGSGKEGGKGRGGYSRSIKDYYGGQYAKHGDAFDKEESIRSFNFLRVKVSPNMGLSVSVIGLAKGGHKTFLLDKFEVPFYSPQLN